MISERATSAAVRPAIRLARTGSGPRLGLRLPQPPQVVEHHVEPQPGDELHHEIMVPVLPAHAEDRHDVGVVQPGRGLRLTLEPAHLLGVEQRPGREHLRGHAAAQRLLLGLVDHAHAAAADLAEDPVVAQPLRAGCPRAAPLSAASEPVVPPESLPRSSIIKQRGNRSRISPASSGWRSTYSRSVGCSPRRLRSRNSSARSSTGLRSSLEVFIVSFTVVRIKAAPAAPGWTTGSP